MSLEALRQAKLLAGTAFTFNDIYVKICNFFEKKTPSKMTQNFMRNSGRLQIMKEILRIKAKTRKFKKILGLKFRKTNKMSALGKFPYSHSVPKPVEILKRFLKISKKF